jgi:GxxExxY protein
MSVVVNELLVLEMKAVESLTKIHAAQLLSYLRLGRRLLGLSIYFHVPLLRDGIKRLAL